MDETFTAAIQQTTPFPWLWLIPLFPFVGAVLNAFFGKKLQDKVGKGAVHAIGIGAMACAAAVAAAAFSKLLSLPAHERYLLDTVFPMVHVGRFHFDMAFAIDPLSGMMALIITFIGTLIHIYSTGYMADEPAYWRFFCYLNLFVFSMLLLVMGDNFALMFFGWEGVGLCSYLLIGFWYEDIEKARAAVKAFVTNRFGDFGFVLGLFLLFWALGGSWVNKTPQPQRAEAPMHANEPAGSEYEDTPLPVQIQKHQDSGFTYVRDPHYSRSEERRVGKEWR